MRLPQCLLVLMIWLPLSLAAESTEEVDLIDALFSNPTFTCPKLSPSGRHLASLWHYKGKRSILVLDLETMKFSGTTVGPGEDVSSFYWIDSEHILLHVSLWEIYTKGLYAYSVKTGRYQEVMLPEDTNLIFRGVVDPLLHVDKTFILKASRSDATIAPDLYRMQLGREYPKRIARNTGEIAHFVVDQSGSPLFGIEYRGGRTIVLRWDPEEKWQAAESIPDEITPLGMLPGNSQMLVSVESDEGFLGLNLLDLETGEFTNKPRYYPGYDLVQNGQPIIDNLNGYLIGMRFHAQKPQNFWFEQTPKSIQDMLAENNPEFDFQYLGYNPESTCIYFIVSSDDVSPGIIQTNLKTGEHALIYRQFPEVNELELCKMRPVAFACDEEDYELHGYLTLPQGPGPYPTIVLVHGGPHVRDTWGFNTEVQYLALNGFAVLQVNYRGSTGYGFHHRLDTLAEIADKSVTDIITGARWLVDKGIADPERIALMGGSFGGFISMAAATREPDMWAAVVSFAGVYDLVALYKQDDRRGWNWVDDMYHDYDEERFKELSPINHVSKIQAPVLLIHGKADHRVNASQAKKLRRALKNNDKDVQTLMTTWGVHGLPEESSRKKYFQTVLSFLEEHIGS